MQEMMKVASNDGEQIFISFDADAVEGQGGVHTPHDIIGWQNGA